MPKAQGCCGALSLHAGRDGEARELARALVASFPDDLDAIIVNAAGCGSHLKTLSRWLRGDARAEAFAAKVRDVTEFLAALPARAPRHAMAIRAAYQDACHLRHAQRIVEEPRELLRGIPRRHLQPRRAGERPADRRAEGRERPRGGTAAADQRQPGLHVANPIHPARSRFIAARCAPRRSARCVNSRHRPCLTTFYCQASMQRLFFAVGSDHHIPQE